MSYDPTLIKEKLKNRLRKYAKSIANLESDKEDLVNLVKDERISALEKDVNSRSQREKFLSAINNIADSLLASYRNKLDNNLQRMQHHIDNARRKKDEIKAILKRMMIN